MARGRRPKTRFSWRFLYQSRVRGGVLLFMGFFTLFQVWYQPSLRPTTTWGQGISSEEKLPQDKLSLFLDNVPLSQLLPKQEETAGAFHHLYHQGACRNSLVVRPTLEQLQFSNEHWQVMTLTNKKREANSVFIYGAYVDIRGQKPLIRILLTAELPFEEAGRPQFCQFWAPNQSTDPVITRVLRYHYIWNKDFGKWGTMHPYLITCAGPSSKWSSYHWESVSLVREQCDNSTTDLRLVFDLPPASGRGPLEFGVCTKGLSFPERDNSRRLVEWIEMLRILGVDTIHFYVFALHPNVWKVLNYYEKQGVVTLKNISLPGHQPTSPLRVHEYLKINLGKVWKQELILYNDCLLRNMYKYKYIAAIDVDEIILPTEAETWHDLLEDLYQDYWISASSLCFKSLAFVNSLRDPLSNYTLALTTPTFRPDTPFMMQRIHYADQEVYSVLPKCIHKTEQVLLIQNHGPRVCLNEEEMEHANAKGRPTCMVVINQEVAYTHHHRGTCCDDEVNFFPTTGDKTLDLKETFHMDNSILGFKEVLTNRSNFVYNFVNSVTN